MYMLLLLFAMALKDTQQKQTQTQHDRNEWAMYQRMQADQASISDIWRPTAKLMSDYDKARSCYVRFHLYKTPNCDIELTQVEKDLGNVDVAQAEGR
jgi:hypothetical protein